MRDSLAVFAAGLLASQFNLLDKLAGWKGGLALLVMTFFAGVGAMATVGEFASHELRIGTLEQWQEAHDDTITGPRVRQIESLQGRQDILVSRLDRIEVLLSCLYYEIQACPGVPNPPPSGGTDR